MLSIRPYPTGTANQEGWEGERRPQRQPGPFQESSARALPEALERSTEERGLESNPGLSPKAPSECKRTLRNRQKHNKLPLPRRETGKGLQV